MPVSSKPTKSRVLVVDDQPEAAELVSVLLEIMGHEHQAATTGASALEQAEKFEPDVVLLELALPDVNGLEIARELRRRAGGKPLHIAAVTRRSHPDDHARSHAAGCDQHLVKPANAAKLRHVMYVADLRARAARRCA
jgi:CheY-like chemotaxis protein